MPTQANSFSPTLYTGTGAAKNIYTPFAPDFTWIKSTTISSSHGLYDTIRGGAKWITSNGTNKNTDTPTALQKFNPNGFTLGDDSGAWGVNASSATYISWSWKARGLPTINNDGTIASIVSANQNAGFSIVKYTGDGGSSKTIGHGLTTQPNLVIFKRIDDTANWFVFFRPEGGNTTGLEGLNTSSNAFSTNYTTFQPSTTTMTTSGSTSDFNGSGKSYIMYNFVNVAGYQKVGTYNGSNSPITIYTTDDGTSTGTNGFLPRFLFIKRTNASGNSWVIIDSARGDGSNAKALFPDLSVTESDNWNTAFISTGFTISSNESYISVAGGEYIYLAIA